MPKYNFRCTECDNASCERMSIVSFRKIKNDPVLCSKCSSGSMKFEIQQIAVSVEESYDQTMMRIEEEVRGTVKKVLQGDPRAVRDVYGTRKNKLKS